MIHSDYSVSKRRLSYLFFFLLILQLPSDTFKILLLLQVQQLCLCLFRCKSFKDDLFWSFRHTENRQNREMSGLWTSVDIRDGKEWWMCENMLIFRVCFFFYEKSSKRTLPVAGGWELDDLWGLTQAILWLYSIKYHRTES